MVVFVFDPLSFFVLEIIEATGKKLRRSALFKRLFLTEECQILTALIYSYKAGNRVELLPITLGKFPDDKCNKMFILRFCF